MKNIVLTGFMGTGKTTVGKLLAKLLDYQFVDTDEVIEQHAGRSIPEIFVQLGEPTFRQMEVKAAQTLGQQAQLVISTGGGMMLNSVNVDALGHEGMIFCLVATPDEILSRLQHDSEHPRPLLAAADPRKRIAEILQARQSAYNRFPQIVTSRKEPIDVAQELLTLVRAAS